MHACMHAHAHVHIYQGIVLPFSLNMICLVQNKNHFFVALLCKHCNQSPTFFFPCFFGFFFLNKTIRTRAYGTFQNPSHLGLSIYEVFTVGDTDVLLLEN